MRAARGEQARLPPLADEDARLVAKQEPEQHVDPRTPLCDPVRLRQVLRLARGGDAEDAVGRIGLVAVLGDPDPLVPVEPRHLADQQAHVSERDRGRVVAVDPGRRRRRRRLARPAVVRVVGVRVEPRRSCLLHRPQERERRERGARGVRVVVAARPGHAAGDLRGAERRHRDALGRSRCTSSRSRPRSGRPTSRATRLYCGRRKAGLFGSFQAIQCRTAGSPRPSGALNLPP